MLLFPGGNSVKVFLKLSFLMSFIMAPFFVLSENQTECVHDANNLRCVKYLKNYDGDTITFNIQDVHPLLGEKINVRVLGVDTPEIKTKNKCELDKARVAKSLVNNLLKNATRIDLTNIQRDKYFRILADVNYDGKSLKDVLIKNNLAYGYFGKSKVAQNWCSSTRETATSDIKK